MVDADLEERIHADVDGFLPDSARAELARRLLADPEARALHRGMHELNRTLEDVGQEPVPAGFRGSVLAAIEARASRPERNATVRGAPRPAGWPVALAFAAGVAAAAVVLRLGSIGPEVDGSGMAGTLAPDATSPTVRIDLPAVRGTVGLRESAGSVAVELDLEVREAVDVSAARDGRIVTLAGVEGGEGHDGRLVATVPLGRAGPAPVTVRFSAAGRLLGEFLLTPGDTR